MSLAEPTPQRPPAAAACPGRDPRIAGHVAVGLWLGAGRPGAGLVPRRAPGTRNSSPNTARWYASGPLTSRSIARGDLDRARRAAVGAGRLCPHVAEPSALGHRLRLRLFLPRHAAARPDLPDLLRLGRVPAAARGRRPVVVLPRSLVLRRASPSRSTRPPTRRKSCAARSRACRAASGRARRRSACTTCRRLRKIILPQALIVALRPYGNEIILMIKGSAVVAIITVYDLMGDDPARLFAQLRFPGLHLGGRDLPGAGRSAALRDRVDRAAHHQSPAALTPFAFRNAV